MRFLQALEKTSDITLRYQFQKEMMKERLLFQRDYDTLVKDTAREVIANLNATADASEIFDAIDNIEKRLNDLGK